MDSTATWSTNETHLHIANTEWMYRRMLECDDADALEEAFAGCISGVLAESVDWQQVFDWFEEDRHGLE